MRMWYGEEKEGSQIGKKTLFVEARFISRKRAVKILCAVAKYGIDRIYLGANRKNVLYLSKSIRTINAEIVIESSKKPTARDMSLCDTYIVRVDTDQNIKKIELKLDNAKFVKMSKNNVYTDLSGLKNGMYQTDIKIK